MEVEQPQAEDYQNENLRRGGVLEGNNVQNDEQVEEERIGMFGNGVSINLLFYF